MGERAHALSPSSRSFAEIASKSARSRETGTPHGCRPASGESDARATDAESLPRRSRDPRVQSPVAGAVDRICLEDAPAIVSPSKASAACELVFPWRRNHASSTSSPTAASVIPATAPRSVAMTANARDPVHDDDEDAEALGRSRRHAALPVSNSYAMGLTGLPVPAGHLERERHEHELVAALLGACLCQRLEQRVVEQRDAVAVQHRRGRATDAPSGSGLASSVSTPSTDTSQSRTNLAHETWSPGRASVSAAVRSRPSAP